MSLRPSALTFSLAAAAVLLSFPASAQLWKKSKVTVRPGQGVGPVGLGKTLEQASPAYLGRPAAAGEDFALFGQGDSRDLRRGLLLRLSEGKVDTIQVRGLRAGTPEGVFLDGPASSVEARYPRAQLDVNPFTRQPEYALPGLVIRTSGKKVSEFLVRSAQVERWRFVPLQIVPGRSVGPIELDKPVSDAALAQLGPPTTVVKARREAGSGMLRWAIAGQDPKRVLEVTLHNGRNPRAVNSVRIRGLRAETDRHVKMGDGVSTVHDIYPEGRTGLQKSLREEIWRVPGANLVCRDGRLSEITVYVLPRPERRN